MNTPPKQRRSAPVNYYIRHKDKPDGTTEYQVMHGNKIIRRYADHTAADEHLRTILPHGRRIAP